ncbi:hypothetical protein B4096_1839 [Heyndrickxia coagulans]|nr:hypothetical protein B4096_1839 [Heyndrickxia coagulans]
MILFAADYRKRVDTDIFWELEEWVANEQEVLEQSKVTRV